MTIPHVIPIAFAMLCIGVVAGFLLGFRLGEMEHSEPAPEPEPKPQSSRWMVEFVDGGTTSFNAYNVVTGSNRDWVEFHDDSDGLVVMWKKDRITRISSANFPEKTKAQCAS